MEVVPGVHVVPGIPWSRVYLIEDEPLVLVDTGPPWSARKVVAYIRSIGRNPEDLGFILMTHSHPDHASSALSLIRRTGAKVVAHTGDTRTHSTRVVRLSRHGPFNKVRDSLPFLRGTPVSETVEDGQRLPILGGVTVVHSPGHTPGSTCYLLEGERLLFTGDTIFSDGQNVSRSVPFPGYNGNDYRKSLDKIAALEFDVLCGGHGASLVGGASDKVRALIASDPEPPTWRRLFAGMPRRMLQSITIGSGGR